jgi:hypothetical protein
MQFECCNFWINLRNLVRNTALKLQSINTMTGFWLPLFGFCSMSCASVTPNVEQKPHDLAHIICINCVASGMLQLPKDARLRHRISSKRSRQTVLPGKNVKWTTVVICHSNSGLTTTTQERQKNILEWHCHTVKLTENRTNKIFLDSKRNKLFVYNNCAMIDADYS